MSNETVFAEESRRLEKVIEEAARNGAPQTAFFLRMAFPTALDIAVRIRSEEQPPARPSPFIYAMQ